MKAKKLLAILCCSTFVLGTAGCGSTASINKTTTEVAEQTAESDRSNSTVTGRVTAIDGNKVTLSVMPEPAEAGGQPPEMPTDDGTDGGSNQSQNESSDDNATPPQGPNGDSSVGNAAPPQRPDGNSSDGNSAPPQRPGGNSSDGNSAPPQRPDGNSSDGNSAPPQRPDGNRSKDGSYTPPQRPGSGSSDSSSAGTKSNSDDSSTSNSSKDSKTKNSTDSSNSNDNSSKSTDANKKSSDTDNKTSAASETIDVDLTDIKVTLADNSEGSVSDLAVDDFVSITFGEDNQVESASVSSGMPGAGSGFGGGSGQVTQGAAATELTSDDTVTGEAYTSTGDDENALRITGATVSLDGVTIDKSAGSSSDTESGDFYGMNAALLATDGATVTIKNAKVTSSVQNGNGVFSYGEGTTVNISDSTIATTADNSGGIQTTGGGTTNASNLTVTTEGNSSAAIRSDRGGGTVTVKGGTYTSNGYNSPAVYSTANITISDATLTATNSEALVIEGRNSIDLTDCTVSGNMSDTKGSSSDINVHNVMIYQSMSGDAADGTSSFSMTGGTLTGNNGDMIYVTNTACTIDLTDVTIENQDSDGNLLNVSGNDASHGWGTAGANGGQATVTATNQTLNGDIVVDSISTLSLTLKDSELTGTINIVDNAGGGTAVKNNAVISIDSGSTWNLTGDCTITSLENNGTINYNGYTITFADGTVLSD